jgi:fructose-specific component phosphotransferase system IIB-like protein
MTRIHIASLLALIVAVPAAAAATYFTAHPSPQQPCFVAGDTAYRMSDGAPATYTVRIDDTAAHPSLRLQIVDDPAAADFVLVDDSDTAGACQNIGHVKSVRLDPAAKTPDLTVALSRAPAAHKIYVKSASFTEQDAAALFTVIWDKARKASLAGRAFAARP